MKNYAKHNSSRIILTLFFLGVLILPFVVFAADPPQPAANTGGDIFGSVGGAITGLLAIPSTAIVATALLVIKAILTAVLSIISYFLNNIFYYNVILSPSNMPAVQEGWKAIRDIVNSFFILIVLWIALSLVLDLGKGNEGKMLARLFIVALLINFSLAIVSATFGIANIITGPIRAAIPADVAGFVVGKARVQTVWDSSSKAAVDRFGSDAKLVQAANSIEDEVRSGPSASSFVPSVLHSFSANATGEVSNPNGCGFGALLDSNVQEKGCVDQGAAGAFADSLYSSFYTSFSRFNVFWSTALDSALSSIFLMLIIAAFTAASGILLMRIVAMVFLAVLSPAAFLAAAIPGGKGEKFWNMWLENLFCWAFIAPVFYFLFWLSLLILDKMTSIPIVANTTNIGFAGNLIVMIPFLVFIAFLFASIKIGRLMGCKMAGEAGAMAVNLAKKLGSWSAQGAAAIATGGASRAATVALSTPAARGALQTLRGPGRWIGGTYAARSAGRFVASQQEKVEKLKKERGNQSKADTLASLQNPYAAKESRIADILRLYEEGWHKKLDAKTQEKYALEAAQYGMQRGILERNPTLINKDNVTTLAPDAEGNLRKAKTILVGKMKDRTEIDASAADEDTLDAIIYNTKGAKGLDRLKKENWALYVKAMKRFDDAREKLKENFKETTDRDAAEFDSIATVIDEYRAGSPKKEKKERRINFVSPAEKAARPENRAKYVDI